MDNPNRKRNLFIVNGAGLVCIALSMLLVTTGNFGWLSWTLLGAAAVLMVVGWRLRP